MSRSQDLTGQKYGHWTVLRRAPKDTSNHAGWICRCDCGKEYKVRQDVLLKGLSTQCSSCSSIETRGKIAKRPEEEVREYMKDHSMSEGTEHFGVAIWTLRNYMKAHGIPPAPRKKPKPYHFKADRPDRKKPKEKAPVQAVKEGQRQADRREQVRKSRRGFREAALEPGLYYEEARKSGRWPYSGQGYMAMMRAYEGKVRQS